MAGTLATPVNISGITVSGSTVTVTTSLAHGLVAGSGFSIQGMSPSNSNLLINSTVATVTSSTVFTFTLASPGTWTSGGTVSRAKDVVVLSVTVPQAGVITLQYALWITTSAPVAKAGAVSQWIGASAQENAALAAGTTIEVIRSISLASASTAAEIKSVLSSDYAAQQSALAATIQPGTYFGVYYDGVGWSI